MTRILGQLWLLAGLGGLLLVAGFGATGASFDPTTDATVARRVTALTVCHRIDPEVDQRSMGRPMG